MKQKQEGSATNIDLRRATRVHEIIAPACKKFFESQNIPIESNKSIGAALARGDFLYVCISTNAGPSVYLLVEVNTLVLQGADTERFLMLFGETLVNIEMANRSG